MLNSETSSIYIHIPFCKSICSYCDFCKFYYHEELVTKYLEALAKEVKLNYNNEPLDTLYIGGGTPSSLSINELTKLFEITKSLNLSRKTEYTIECNVMDLTKEKLNLFKQSGVNRLSIGVESFNDQILSFLERTYNKNLIIEKVNLAKEYFTNINIDLMYAVPNETLEILKTDLKYFLELDVPHISIYSLIIEDHTKLKINNIKEIDSALDREMYDTIEETLTLNGYNHYEVSNYGKSGYQSKHNLTYWQNKKYYGFGLGAGGYIKDVRYTNTRNINEYLKGKYRYEEEVITKETFLSNMAILGFRTIYGVSKQDFFNASDKDFITYFSVHSLLESGLLLERDDSYYINPKYWYVMNDILVKFI